MFSTRANDIDAPKTETLIPGSANLKSETKDADGLQRAGSVALWKKTCSDNVYTNMYRFGICQFKYHRAEYTKFENLQTCLGNLAVEQAKAK